MFEYFTFILYDLNSHLGLDLEVVDVTMPLVDSLTIANEAMYALTRNERDYTHRNYFNPLSK
jgi:hypothetical protein